MANSNSQILKNISDSIKEADRHLTASYSSSSSETIVRNTIQLMVDNVGLLVQCSNEYGCPAGLVCYLEWIKQARSWGDDKDLGKYLSWIEFFARPELCAGVRRSLVEQIELWSREVNADLQKRRKPGSNNIGRPPKYSDQTLEAASKLYEQCMLEGSKSKPAWVHVAKIHGFPSPKSAEERVRKWKKKRKLEQN